MGSYLGKRIGYSLISLVGLVVLVFFLARLTGDPTDLFLPMDSTLQVRQEFAALHGFDKPVTTQFLHYLGNLAQFDFGESLRQRKPALDLIMQALPTTLLLSFYAMSISLLIAIITGSVAAYRPGGLFDRIASLISLAGASIPNFWVAIVGVLIFSVAFRVLPTSGTGTPLHWVLPVMVLFIRPCGLLTQVVRSSMMTVLNSTYVKTAQAKGVRPKRIIFVHCLRNAMLPIVTVAGDQAAGMINGAVIAETIFGFPGIGKLMIDAILFRDFAVIQAAVLITAIGIFALNIMVDVIYAVLDPRIRYN